LTLTFYCSMPVAIGLDCIEGWLFTLIVRLSAKHFLTHT